MTGKKTKAVYALAMLCLFGFALLAFILAANEQSVISSGSPAVNRISLQDLVAQGPGKNKHIELVDFYFGRTFIYTTELVQFNEVYVPVFPRREPEDGANLRLWARHFPTQDSANTLWGVCALCLGGSAVCAVFYKRHRGSS
jgi:hypothetical protein